ncbi:hypothetical protein HQN89_36465 [Paenibacillus frigoriresistens]|uniref:hypothetical protein n=1 Tax=Paenibacillus alginolyticus TaxID=59839 RepID=UPI0015653FB6|nr:hypothetical protein [Paenibacillus frigoriresistens]NRF96265.1 hypothetical protein [Paenibacillus frigoriresistens]
MKNGLILVQNTTSSIFWENIKEIVVRRTTSRQTSREKVSHICIHSPPAPLKQKKTNEINLSFVFLPVFL